ncbi:MAG: bifunctional sugar-1-phosphate nucleotidylyltransferase/acetyltransferase [Candidatus Bathyarchaeia archaeon]
MKAVVLAAGEGLRLRPFTYTRPKHLIPVGGRPILEHILTALRDAGLREALLVVHHKADMIKDYFGEGEKLGMKIEYIIQPKILGTADAASMAEDYVADDFLMIYGDLLITPNVISMIQGAHERNRSAATVSIVPVEHPERYGVVKVEGSQVIDIVEKPSSEAAPDHRVNAGIYIFSTEIFKAIRQTGRSQRGEREITDSIRLLIDERKSVTAVEIPGQEWLDIGRPWDLFEANIRILNRIEPKVNGLVEDGTHLIGPVTVAEEARIRSGAYIEGPVLIDEGSDVGPNCYIRPYTTVGKNARIGNACEIKNSIIMDGTRIGHLSYIGDSVIGEGCNLGAGTITANLRFDSMTIKMSIKGETVNSGRKKLGALIGDHVKTGIGTLLMPGVQIGCNSWIGPNVVVYEDVQPDTILVLRQTLEHR